ncbi:lysophospholipid acyltransferase family protein [Nocardioides solisilvae]|uniref:lysophospholipid acyltransferase family protein n=1 Tax=Nocardioides solisilvae TaxID=1542435 RepID=UPI00194DDBCB|nr:lysophospholipid acyltransferase family protein [Nocardioides solisilvae]
MPLRKLTMRHGWGFLAGNIILRPTLGATTTHTWTGAEKIPASGGCVLVLNHISHADPLVSAHFVYDAGRLPRYLAKSALFRSNKFVVGVLRSTGQIPVERLTKDAVGAYDAAVAAVQRGECVVVYPEGTLTRDPDLWPMRGKSGAARIALATGVPVLPVAHWGAHRLLPPYSKRPHLLSRTHLTVRVGDPVPLDDLRERATEPGVVQEATDRIMAALVAELEEVRGEKAPAERFDPRRAGLRQIGNPNDPATRRRRSRTTGKKRKR